MQIKLQNIGIIKDSTLNLDGLTVITGKNNSGKTTVGKTLYSLLDATCDIQRKADTDKCYYIQRKLFDIGYYFDFVKQSPVNFNSGSSLMKDHPNLRKLIFQMYFSISSLDDILQYAHDLADELQNLDCHVFDGMGIRPQLFRYEVDGSKANSLSAIMEKRCQKALADLNQLFEQIENDFDLSAYIKESINQTLRNEFDEQIQPIALPNALSAIKLFHTDSVFFNISIEKNNIIENKTPIFYENPYKDVFLIDDPFVLDNINNNVIRPLSRIEARITKPGHIYSHNEKLKVTLESPSLSILEKTFLDDSLKPIRQQIDQVLPGTFDFSNEGNYYVQNGAKLKLGNLAAGSKLLSIIKILLDKGKLNETTLLILDEPESHLHPQWQNVFAEIVVLLVKVLHVNVLLTTHSPNFMLAIDAFMRKHQISEVTNFYQTEIMEDHFVRYRCVNDDMGQIYQDFLQYLSEMKILRKKYLESLEN